MRRIGMTVAVGAFLAGAIMGVSDCSEAQGNKSNIIGPAPVSMQTGSSNRNVVKMNKSAVQKLQYRPTKLNRATPMPLPGPR